MRRTFLALAMFLLVFALCGSFFYVGVSAGRMAEPSVQEGQTAGQETEEDGEFSAASGAQQGTAKKPQATPSANTAWYTKNKKAEAFYIETAEDLLGLSEIVGIAGENFSGRTIYLSREIDLQNTLWKPVGSKAKPFKGVFDGGNLNISNVVLPGDIPRSGFFAYVEQATIKNLVLDGFKCSASGQEMPYFGGLAAEAAFSSFINCRVNNISVNMEKADISHPVGGMVGRAESIVIDGCEVSGNIVGAAVVGGLVGELKVAASGGDNLIKNSLNKASISGKSYVGGIAGVVGFSRKGTNKLENVSNSGNIVGATYVGGIAGGFGGGSIQSSLSSAAIKGTMYVGGIVGSLYSTVQNSYTLGSVSASKNGAGGIAGAADSSRISACYSLAEVRGASDVGGIVGAMLSNDAPSSLENLFALNTGVVSGDAGTAGRIVGLAELGLVCDGNMAWVDMGVNGAYVGQSVQNGVGVNLQSLKNGQLWPAIFKVAPWVYVVGGVPVLAGQKIAQNAKVAGHLRNHLDNPAADVVVLDKLASKANETVSLSFVLPQNPKNETDSSETILPKSPQVEISYNGTVLLENEDFMLLVKGEAVLGYVDCEIIGMGDYAKKIEGRFVVPTPPVLPPEEVSSLPESEGTGEASNAEEEQAAQSPPQTGDDGTFVPALLSAGVSLFALVFIFARANKRKKPEKNQK